MNLPPHRVVAEFIGQVVGEHTFRGGLADTPSRVLKAWAEYWGSGYGIDPASVLTTFVDGAEDYDQMIVVSGLPVYSHCEHHIAPFWGEAHVGYVPNGKIVGLSKFGHLVNIFARRLQVQERLTKQVAQAIEENLKPRGCGVILRCRHMCMESRGLQAPGTLTITSALTGIFKTEHAVREEFLQLKTHTKGLI